MLKRSFEMGFTYLSRWIFVVFFVKNANPTSHIPHRLWSGFACFLKPIKGASLLMKYTHLSPQLKAICSIAQLFWVFTFCLNFLGN